MLPVALSTMAQHDRGNELNLCTCKRAAAPEVGCTGVMTRLGLLRPRLSQVIQESDTFQSVSLRLELRPVVSYHLVRPYPDPHLSDSTGKEVVVLGEPSS